MNYGEAKKLAETEGTDRRKKTRRVAQSAMLWAGAIIITVGLVWWPTGPIQTYKNKPVQTPASSQQAQQRVTPAVCTTESPCSALVTATGATEKVGIPQGKTTCFDPEFWTDLPKLGYRTSFKGRDGPMGDTSVSADTFWFEPQAGVPVPRHWFVPEGSTQC
jgi:hypothetical protein